MEKLFNEKSLFNKWAKAALIGLAGLVSMNSYANDDMPTNQEGRETLEQSASQEWYNVDMTTYDEGGFMKVSDGNYGLDQHQAIIEIPSLEDDTAADGENNVDAEEPSYLESAWDRTGIFFGSKAGIDGPEIMLGLTHKPVDLPWGLSVGLSSSVTHKGNVAGSIHVSETQELWPGGKASISAAYHYDTLLEDFGVDAEYQTISAEFNQMLIEQIGLGVIASYTRYYNLRADDQYVEDTFYGISQRAGKYATLQMGVQNLKLEDGTVGVDSKFQIRYGINFG